MQWIDSSIPEQVTGIQVHKGKRGIMVEWNRSRSSDLKEYAVFRSNRKITPENLEKYQIIARVRGSQDFYEDRSVRKFVKFHFTIVAVDRTGNLSTPSAIGSIRY